MQKKKSTRSTLSNFVTVIICCSGIALSAYLFWQDFNQSLTRNSEQQIATITFKYKSAQRKFIDRIIWDRLKNKSPIYNGDTIRTAALSEATVEFIDGNTMSLHENTLAQIFYSPEGLGAEINFTEGNISVDTVNSGKAISISSGGTQMTVETGSSLTAAIQKESNNAEPSSLRVQVMSGNAVISTLEGEQVIAEGTSVQMNEGETPVITQSVLLTSPAHNSRILNNSGKAKEIEFKWTNTTLPTNSRIQLETATDRDFTNILDTLDISEKTRITLTIPNGPCYWRIQPILEEGNTQSITGDSGKITILNAPDPVPVAPTEKNSISYRTKLPNVRFVWKGNEWISSYQIEIADNENINNPLISRHTTQTSLIVKTLEKGTYYWRVTPYYTINNIGFTAPSKVTSLIIEQSGDLSAPQLTLPVDAGFVNSLGVNSSVFFSWKNEYEAKTYTFRLSENADMSNPLISEIGTENFYNLNTLNYSMKNGQWYWNVYQTDIEGNNSPTSPTRSFIATEAEIIQRSVFPPDKFSIASNLIADTVFSWKTNISFATRFQIADNPAFKNPIYDEPISSLSTQNKYLNKGTWYWRIKAEVSNDVELATPAKEFYVVQALPEPLLSTPKSGTKVVIKNNGEVGFTWQKVSNADYYQFKLYDSKDETKVLVEKPYVTDLSVLIPLGLQDEGVYSWSVQSFSEESLISTRRTGLIAQDSFTLRILKPIVMKNPANGSKIEGLSALRKPIAFSWFSEDNMQSSHVIVSNTRYPLTAKSSNVVYNSKDGGTSFKLPRLTKGTYYWTVEGTSYDSLNISAENIHSFTILPVPLIPAPKVVSPASETVYGPAEIQENKQVVFKWTKNSDATGYIFTLYQDKKPIIQTDIIKETSFLLEDLTMLDNGQYSWEVEALAQASDGFFEQRGQKKPTFFTINVPKIGSPIVSNPGTLYGR